MVPSPRLQVRTTDVAPHLLPSEEKARDFDLIVGMLKKYAWSSQRDSRVFLKDGVEGKNGTYSVAVNIAEERDLVIIYVLSNSVIPELRRAKVAEFISLANNEIATGSFAMDHIHGTLRYKSTLEGDQLTLELVQAMIGASLLTMDRYYPGAMSVSYGSMDPAEAVGEKSVSLNV